MTDKDNEKSGEELPKFSFTYNQTVRTLRTLKDLDKLWLELSDVPYGPKSSKYQLRVWFRFLGFAEIQNGQMRLTPRATAFLKFTDSERRKYIQEVLMMNAGFKRFWTEICNNADEMGEIDRREVGAIMAKHYGHPLAKNTLTNRLNILVNLVSNVGLWKKGSTRRGLIWYHILVRIVSVEKARKSYVSAQDSLNKIGSTLYHITHGHHQDVDVAIRELGNLQMAGHISEDSYQLLLDILDELKESNEIDLHKILSRWHYRKTMQIVSGESGE